MHHRVADLITDHLNQIEIRFVELPQSVRAQPQQPNYVPVRSNRHQYRRIKTSSGRVDGKHVRVCSEILNDPRLAIEDCVDDLRALAQHCHLSNEGLVQAAPGKHMKCFVCVLPNVYRTRIYFHYRQNGIEGVVRNFLEVKGAVDGIGDKINRRQTRVAQGLQCGCGGIRKFHCSQPRAHLYQKSSVFSLVSLDNMLHLMSNPDKLEEIFRLQEQLNKRIGVDTASMTDEQRQQWVLNYCRAMTQEVAELTDSVPWKWWAKYQKFDKQNARVEVIDLLHFLVSIAQVLEMTPADFSEAYAKKHQVNLARQDSGYQTKDEHDSKHI